jgi:hypothetical protein
MSCSTTRAISAALLVLLSPGCSQEKQSNARQFNHAMVELDETLASDIMGFITRMGMNKAGAEEDFAKLEASRQLGLKHLRKGRDEIRAMGVPAGQGGKEFYEAWFGYLDFLEGVWEGSLKEIVETLQANQLTVHDKDTKVQTLLHETASTLEARVKELHEAQAKFAQENGIVISKRKY